MGRMIESVVSRLARPLPPRPTDTLPRLPTLEGIRAVLFDVYGTLLVSGSGDVGLTAEGDRGAAADAALQALGLPLPDDPRQTGDRLLAAIAEEHERLKAEGVDFPEVRIEELWRAIAPAADAERLAIEYEMRVNPVDVMPGMTQTLDAISGSGRPLGIVSNAQFFTPRLLEPLCGRTPRQLGFEPDLCVWSYAHRRAKPGTFLYERAAEALAGRGIAPRETLYVGNDMRNDVWPAGRVGFRTALFAGDARSLRLREADADVAGVTADVVLTRLDQIPTVLGL